MAFTPRTFSTILEDMFNYVTANTDLTDLEIGDVVRTVLEAAALEDDEQYFQMVELLDAFKLSNSKGADLDDRLAEYNLIRRQPTGASGKVVITNNALITNALKFTTTSGATTVVLNDSSSFPASGTIRIGEGTLQVEDVAYTANNTSTGTLTLSSSTLNNHSIGDRISLVTGTDKTLQISIQVQQPPQNGNSSVLFTTVVTGSLIAGNFYSTPISTKATVPGISGNVGIGAITSFVSSPPFDGASVTNTTRFTGGKERETDDEFIARAKLQLRTLSGGTKLALQQGSLGITDPVTGQSANTVNIFEDFEHDQVVVYVDDGTGFTPDKVQLAESTISLAILVPTSSVQVASAASFPAEGYLLLSPEDSSRIELVHYTSVNYSTNTFALAAATTKNHNVLDEVVLVDVLTLSSEDGRKRFQTANYPVQQFSQRVWISDSLGTLTLQDLNTNYLLNWGTGELEVTGGGVELGGTVVATYTYFTGLIATVQQVIEGSPNNPTNFPGIKSAGIFAIVETPIIRRISVHITITAANGFTADDLKPLVQEAIANYISGLGIGNDVIAAEIIFLAMNIPGVSNAVISLPTQATIPILENELPVPYDSNKNSLIIVS